MPGTTHPELYSLITNMCKPPKELHLPEGEQPFDLRFYEFVILGGKMEPIVCLLFYLAIKMWEIHYKNHIKQQTAVENNIKMF